MAQHVSPNNKGKSSDKTEKFDAPTTKHTDETKRMDTVKSAAATVKPANATAKFNAAGATPKMPEIGKKRKTPMIIGAVVGVVAVIVACVVAFGVLGGNNSSSEYEALDIPSDTSEVAENPIKWDELKGKNPDVYSYIYLPNTNVSLPVLQNSAQDNYYLNHDIDGINTIVGAIYSQVTKNKTDYKDPVTVLYGHTLNNGTMFSELHKLEDQTFFNANPNFYIYTPDKVLTYEIVSAFEYDDRHIMNSFDFTKPEVVQEFFDYVVNPDSPNKKVRDGIKLNAADDNIIVLSTCTVPSNDSRRYLVVGHLKKEQDTIPAAGTSSQSSSSSAASQSSSASAA